MPKIELPITAGRGYRRWCQFSIAALLIATLVVGAFLAGRVLIEYDVEKVKKDAVTEAMEKMIADSRMRKMRTIAASKRAVLAAEADLAAERARRSKFRVTEQNSYFPISVDLESPFNVDVKIKNENGFEQIEMGMKADELEFKNRLKGGYQYP